jgi:hypothetical protein
MTEQTFCTGCSRLPDLCDGNALISFKISWKNHAVEFIVQCDKCKEKKSMLIPTSIKICCDDPVLNETRRLLSIEWEKTHSKEITGRIFYFD